MNCFIFQVFMLLGGDIHGHSKVTFLMLLLMLEAQKQALQQQTDLALENERKAKQQEELAKTHAERAKKQTEYALQAANAVTYELVETLKDKGVSKLLSDILAKNAALLEKIHALNPDNQEAKREYSVNLNKLGDNWLILGKTDAALEYYQKSLGIREEIVQADPSSLAAKRDLSVSYNNLGDVQVSLGKTDAALEYYQKLNQIDKEIVQADPSSLAAKRDVMVSYYKLGNLQEALENLPVALQYYQQALSIAERLAQDKLNKQAQDDLAILQELVKRFE